ncbi:hypothetical protein SAMN06295967_10355 [Belliella buryatensis]|uniref:Uncharacterized protein n=1 Tax=Belliella buryatensis TaxID=1500549 RepID=A0A239BMG6_9BACT|nr:hypothetical protein SAMN06295967_10355 [Belliella buryatensis]
MRLENKLLEVIMVNNLNGSFRISIFESIWDASFITYLTSHLSICLGLKTDILSSKTIGSLAIIKRFS